MNNSNPLKKYAQNPQSNASTENDNIPHEGGLMLYLKNLSPFQKTIVLIINFIIGVLLIIAIADWIYTRPSITGHTHKMPYASKDDSHMCPSPSQQQQRVDAGIVELPESQYEHINFDISVEKLRHLTEDERSSYIEKSLEKISNLHTKSSMVHPIETDLLIMIDRQNNKLPVLSDKTDELGILGKNLISTHSSAYEISEHMTKMNSEYLAKAEKLNKHKNELEGLVNSHASTLKDIARIAEKKNLLARNKMLAESDRDNGIRRIEEKINDLRRQRDGKYTEIGLNTKDEIENKILEITDTIDSLTSQKTHCEKEIFIWDHDKKEYLDVLQQLEDEISTIEDLLPRLNLKEEMFIRAAQLEHLIKNQIELRNHNIEANCMLLQQSFHALKDKMIEIEKRNMGKNNLKKNETVYKEYIGYLSKISDSYQQEKDILKKIISNQFEYLSNSRKSVNSLRDDIARLKESIHLTVHSHDDLTLENKLTKLNKERTDIQDKIRLLENQMRKCKGLTEDNLKQVNALKMKLKELEKARDYLDGLTKEMNRWDSEMTALKKSFDVAITNFKNDISSIEAEENGLKNSLVEVESRIRQKNYEVQSLLNQPPRMDLQQERIMKYNENLITMKQQLVKYMDSLKNTLMLVDQDLAYNGPNLIDRMPRLQLSEDTRYQIQ